jgi:DNA-binding IclR family transcriptional regulator
MDGSRVLDYLRHHGQGVDSEIASALGMPLPRVHHVIESLSAQGQVLVCRTTQFCGGARVETLLCRVSGYVPPARPGRKPKR